MPRNANSLPYGIYFGRDEIRQEIPGFSVSLLTPTLRAEDVPLHSHENASFVFVLSGAYISSADGAGRVCSEPTLIFNPTGTTHRDSFRCAQGRFLAVSISNQSLRVAADGTAPPTVAIAFKSGDGVNTAVRLVQQCAHRGLVGSTTMEALCWELLSSVFGATFWPDRSSRFPPPWIDKAHELLHDRSSGSVPIAEMAQQLGLHPVYFARAFRHAFRCTPGEYRMRCRLRDAMTLMRNPGIPLSEIALRSGFFDQSHFSTSFHEHFGITPHAYRGRLHGDGARSKVQFVQEKTE